ncbi:aminoglycoside phosphotransferase [Streptomyces zinciresistens K42]|uniref:Aminoglycoside phosphotransferase n=1 Tax=Streptomyces zinciresistens K42 TaxID=700597 RepID=G2GA40_9ACTN|nr:hypothetical protein [Streptomyces zinciresistens]EGX59632.1 aminoglycoside phosphotransferase [Streptomyces zinciresistens K42]
MESSLQSTRGGSDIRDWIAHWNEDPKPFTWTKSADEIFERLAGYLNRLPNPKP